MLLVNSFLVILFYVIRIFRKPPKDAEPNFSPLHLGMASFLAIIGLLLSPTREPLWVWVVFVSLDLIGGFFAHRRYGKEWRASRRHLQTEEAHEDQPK